MLEVMSITKVRQTELRRMFNGPSDVPMSTLVALMKAIKRASRKMCR